MTKYLLVFLSSALFAVQGCAQFIPGQVLGAAALNAALASPTILGGSINGSPIGQSNPKAVNATSFGLVGAGSGTISILPQSAAGTYNFNLPTTAGAAGSVLTSSAGGSSPMTWSAPSSLSVGVSAASTTSPTTTSAAFYPTFVGSVSAGNQPLYTSGNFSYNPGTGVLYSPKSFFSSSITSPGTSTGVTANTTVALSGNDTFSSKVGFSTTISVSGAYSIGDINAFYTDVSSAATGTTGQLYGSATFLRAQGSSTTQGLTGSYIEMRNEAPNTVTSATGYYVSSSTNSGTFTNTYGVKVGTITTGVRTNKPYSFIAEDDNARNSFAGITLFPNATEATSTTTGAVRVTGGLAIAKSLYVGNAIGVTQTITAAGVTGAQTINKAAGTVNFGPGASSLVVTNSLVSTASTVLCSVRTSDATAYVKNCVPAAGSFTANLGAAATAETSVGFLVIN